MSSSFEAIIVVVRIRILLFEIQHQISELVTAPTIATSTKSRRGMYEELLDLPHRFRNYNKLRIDTRDLKLFVTISSVNMLAVAVVSVIVGVACHLAYFHHGEHHLYGKAYLQTFSLGFITAVIALVKLAHYSILSALALVSVAATSYLTGIFTSVLVYRIFFSPLNKFPGPWQAKISSLWLPSQLKNFDGYLKFEELHKKYGKYVRIGSNDLSISDADLHEIAFGPNTEFRKSTWYDISKPFNSMHTTRDKALHDRRRRIWAPAFSDKALREYETTVKAFNNKLVERVREHQNGEPMDMSKWFNLYSFDVMGRLAFGKDYNMLEHGERHWALDLLAKGMESAPPRLPTWVFRLLLAIPFAAKGFYKFLKFAHDELEWRANNKEATGDITGWLLKAYKDFDKPADDPMFNGDSRLIIVAGSDTTAATLTFLFYELAKRPEEIEKLRRELRPLAQGDWSDIDIKSAVHLNGAISEALRLHPPVPSGVERKVPKGGVQVSSVFLPAETSFWMPQYVIGRDEDNYENALEFVPERWYSKPDMIKHKNALAVFSLGSEACIGKNLALMELRTLTTQLLLDFDVKLAPGEDGKRLLYETRDHFTLGLGQLDLVFTKASS